MAQPPPRWDAEEGGLPPLKEKVRSSPALLSLATREAAAARLQHKAGRTARECRAAQAAAAANGGRGAWCRLALGSVLAYVTLQVVGCGVLVGTQLPYPANLAALFRQEVYQSFGGEDARFDASFSSDAEAPKLIPNVLHQTYATYAVPYRMRAMMNSWRRLNPEFSVRFYDDAACLAFVRREFPEYVEPYRALPKDVERADFFRYMVVLRLGGYYADVDTECRQPLARVARPTDTLIAGYEGEFATAEGARARRFVRQRQVQQWFFAAAPGHPALRDACDRIAERARMQFSNDTNRDTLQKTGPGLWTDVVMNAAQQHPSSPRDPWSVRLLPRVAFGAHPKGLDGVPPDARDVMVLHHYAGSWKASERIQEAKAEVVREAKVVVGWVVGGGAEQRGVGRDAAAEQRGVGRDAAAEQRGVGRDAAAEQREPDHEVGRDAAANHREVGLVSALWEPPFDLFVFSAAGADGLPPLVSGASRAVTAWGRWQYDPERVPRPIGTVEPIVGVVGRRGGALLDVTPGLGFATLATAARGLPVVALAEEGDVALPLLRRSLARLLVAGSEAAAEVREVRRGEVGPEVRNVTAVRLGAVDAGGAWGAEVVRRVAVEQRPAVVLVEFQARREGGAELLETLWNVGYRDVAHSGAACEERWANVTRGVDPERAVQFGWRHMVRGAPSWCRVGGSLEELRGVLLLGSREEPEAILFKWVEGAEELLGARGRGEKSGGAEESSSS